MKSNNEDRLHHWREQQRELVQMLEDLPINSIAIPSLEEDLSVASEKVAHYEALEARGDSETGPA